MKLKKLTALVLAGAMLFALCGCGKTVIEAYDDGTETAQALDFEAAWAAHDPEDVVFYVDGEGVTWRELFYEIVYYTNYVAYSEGTAITSMSDVCSLFTDEDGNYYTYGAVVLQNAVTLLEQYHVVYKRLSDLGVVLGKEALDSVEQVRQNAIDQNFDGDEQAFLDYLDSMYCTEELWNWFNQVDAMYAYDGFDTLYGEFGSKLSDEDVLAYAAGDEDGVWTEYVQIKQIYLYEEETDGEDETEASGETAGTGTEAAADSILAALAAAQDKDAAFRELYAQYNENAALDDYPDGWCIYEGDTDDAVYQAALGMEDYDCAAVSVDGARVVVMKVPIDPDGGVYYDGENDIMYTLRYYAAWQAYSDLINGEDGWIASAQADWAEGFENFSLEELF